MPKLYLVKRGDHLSRIAYRHGVPEQVIWDHPRNAKLKGTRDPNVLMPGDEVFIPDVELRQVTAQSDGSHAYRCRLPPITFRARLLRNERPAADMPYELELDGDAKRAGVTDGEGWLKEPIHPYTERAKLSLKEGETYLLAFGRLAPEHTPAGVQARLRTLGYHTEAITGAWDPPTIKALKAFQLDNRLEPTGDADERTRRLLKDQTGA